MSISMQGIRKAFGSNEVLRDVDFSLADGEIRALIGENGAGKTTLMNILGGVVRADGGALRVDGAPVQFHTPRESLDAGIAFIHQELNLVEDLSVYENLFIGRELRNRAGFLDAAEMCRRAGRVLEGMGVPLSPKALVRDLDAPHKQVVEIARALLMKARHIIMDEPTTSLTEVEIGRVFALMRQMSGQGISIVFISHKLGEVLEICHTYTVLRDGRVVAGGRTAETTTAALARHMVGHEVRSGRRGRGPGHGKEAQAVPGEEPAGAIALRAEGLSLGRAFRDITFSARRGEILGFTGLLGDGRGPLFRSIFEGAKGLAGQVFVHGRPVRPRGPDKSLRLGLGYVPSNRKQNGIAGDLSILENITLVIVPRLTRWGLIDHGRERAACEKQVRELRIKAERLELPIGSLSGGNQQKAVLAKWLAASPGIMILDNPTQGVDVGAKEEIYDIVEGLAARDVAVIVLSGEAQEIVRLCDRALILYHGEIRGELAGEALDEHNIMVLATGGSTPAPADPGEDVRQ